MVEKGKEMADLLKVMERECLHSEHAALCFLAAKRKARKANKANRAAKQSEKRNGPDVREDIIPPSNAG